MTGRALRLFWIRLNPLILGDFSFCPICSHTETLAVAGKHGLFLTSPSLLKLALCTNDLSPGPSDTQQSWLRHLILLEEAQWPLSPESLHGNVGASGNKVHGCGGDGVLFHQTTSTLSAGTESEFSLALGAEKGLRNVCSWRGGWMDKQKTCLSVGIFSFSYSLSLIPFSVVSFVLFLWKINF